MDRSRTIDGESGDGSFREIFTCESGIENLQMSEELKQKLSRLCAKVDKTFRMSPSQREKVMKFSEHIEEANLIDKFKVPLGIWRAHDSHKFNFSAFTNVECETIKENYQRFCKEFGFDPKRDINIFLPSTHATHNGIDALKKKDLQVFYFYISRNMPDRAPRSIYTKFMKIFYAYRTGPFSEVEDELLTSWYDLNPGKHIYATLGRILRRSRFLVRRRLLRLIGPEGKVGVNSYTPPYVEDVLERDNNSYPDWTNNEEAWQKIADMSHQFTVKELKKSYFQEVYPSVRASDNVTSLQFKRKLIENLSSMENPTWDTVDWVKLGEDCYNVGAVRVYSVIRKLTKKYVPNECWGNLADALLKIKNRCGRLSGERRDKKDPHDSDAPEDGSPRAKSKRGRQKSSLVEENIRKKLPRKAKQLRCTYLTADDDDSNSKCSIKISAPHTVFTPCDVEDDDNSNSNCSIKISAPHTVLTPCDVQDDDDSNSNCSIKISAPHTVLTPCDVEDDDDSVVWEDERSPQHKKKREKLDTVEMKTESPCSETDLKENSEAKETKDEKSSAIGHSEVTLSPKRMKKREKSDTVETGTKTPCSETDLKENSEAKETKDEESSSAIELSEVTVSPKRKKQREILNTVKTGTEILSSETDLKENSEAKETKNDKSSAIELNEVVTVSPKRKKIREKLDTVETGTETPCSEMDLKKNSEANETKVEKSCAFELSEVTVSPKRKKIREKLDTVETGTKILSSGTELEENSEAKETKDDKSSAIELNEVVTVSPKRKKIREKLDTAETGTETPCSETDLKENSEANETKVGKSCAIELSEVTVSPKRKKIREKSDTVETGTKILSSQTELKENSEAKETKDDKSSAIELNEVVTVSPKRKKIREKLDTVETGTKTPCSETDLRENSEAKETNDEKSFAIELSEVTVSPKRKKKRGKLDTVEMGTETPCSETG